MSLHLLCVFNNPALESFGIPFMTSKQCIPCLCCKNPKKCETESSSVKIEGKEFESLDGKTIYVVCSATYVIDTPPEETIMEAYESDNSDKLNDVKPAIKNIITTLLRNKFKLMEFSLIVKSDMIFIDKLFEEANAELQPHKVKLQFIKINEIIEYVEDEEENNEKSGKDDTMSETVVKVGSIPGEHYHIEPNKSIQMDDVYIESDTITVITEDDLSQQESTFVIRGEKEEDHTEVETCFGKQASSPRRVTFEVTTDTHCECDHDD